MILAAVTRGAQPLLSSLSTVSNSTRISFHASIAAASPGLDLGVIRDQAEIQSLRRFKNDVREVAMGFECGIKIQGFDDLKPGDIIEAYEVVQIARTL